MIYAPYVRGRFHSLDDSRESAAFVATTMRDAPGPREEKRRHVFNQVSQFTVELESSVVSDPAATNTERPVTAGRYAVDASVGS